MTAHPDWLQKYIDRGFRFVFYDTKSKGPSGPDAKGWKTRTYTPDEWHDGLNVGVMTGHEIQPGKFLVDIDFDWPEGLPMVKRLMPPTGFGFGRPSRPLSHAFYTVSTPTPLTQFKDPSNKMLVELRGSERDGAVGLQTMVPPSVHPTGERLELRADNDIAHADDILRRVTHYAIACLLLQQLGHRGLLHDVRLSLAGFLLKCRLTPEEVIAIGEAVAEASGNNIADVSVAVNSTNARLAKGDRVQGASALAKAIGDDGKAVVNLIREWLGESEFTTNGKGTIDPSDPRNTQRALEKLGYYFCWDDFNERVMYRKDESLHYFDDNFGSDLRLKFPGEFGFLPAKDHFFDVVGMISRENPYHPVKEYLGSLKWDGKPRVNEWLIISAKAADTEYTRAISSIVLIAAVRRILQPGCKFDEMMVLESEQGLQKSTALSLLCADETWFSDDLPLDVDAKQLIERTSGKWIIEAAELSGMRKSNMEHLKAMLSRRADGPVRKAYGRTSVTVPRQWIIIGTTNNHTYLTDYTGNRRFWPLRVEAFDLDWIRENRDQLWAEAVSREAAGESIRLPEHLYEIAGIQQERRRSEDPWEEKLASHFDGEDYRLAPDEIWEILGIPVERRDERGQLRVSQAMQRLGFRRMAIRYEGKVVKGWAKGDAKNPRQPVTLTPEEIEEGQRLLDDM